MKKILIVDDEPNIVMSLEYAFRKKKFAVFIARDGSEALEILQSETPDIVLLDIMMPQVNGYETLNYIKGQPHLNNTKVIFISAKSKKEDIKKGINLGASDYITKPFSIKKVMNRIEELLKK